MGYHGIPRGLTFLIFSEIKLTMGILHTPSEKLVGQGWSVLAL